jgi:hypothetical protein
MLGKDCTIELHLQPWENIFIWTKTRTQKNENIHLERRERICKKKKIKVKKENLTEYLMMSKIALDMMTLFSSSIM